MREVLQETIIFINNKKPKDPHEIPATILSTASGELTVAEKTVGELLEKLYGQQQKSLTALPSRKEFDDLKDYNKIV